MSKGLHGGTKRFRDEGDFVLASRKLEITSMRATGQVSFILFGEDFMEEVASKSNFE